MTQSVLQEFLICPERAQLAVKMGLTSGQTSGPVSFGDIVHKALDTIYGTWMTWVREKEMPPGGLEQWLTSVVPNVLTDIEIDKQRILAEEVLAGSDAYEALEESIGIANVVLRHYVRRWAEDFSDMHWHALEQVFDVPYLTQKRLGIDRPNIRRRGKIDGVPEIRGKIWLFETKTKARIDDLAIVDKLGYEFQVNFYMDVMRELYGVQPQGVIYNLIRRPQLKRKQKESIAEFCDRVDGDIGERQDFYFLRYHAAVEKSELRRWREQFNSIMRLFIMWYEEEFHYRNSAACNGMMGVCKFIKICAHDDLTGFYKRAQIFNELSTGAEE